MKIKIINHSNNPLPHYATSGSAGMDLRAHLPEAVILNPLERRVIPTGVSIELPRGYEAQVRPRSGLALKKGLSIPNAPGTIDSDYRGEIGVIIINLSNTPVTIDPSERIAQLVIAKHETIEWLSVEELTSSERGAGGYGSTGKL
ncbi:MAG: dUTP diphosphatase [Aureispira sp.]